MKSSDGEKSRERHTHLTETNYENLISLDGNCYNSHYLTERGKFHQRRPLPLFVLESSERKDSNGKQKSCQAKLLKMCDPAFLRRMIPILQNQDRAGSALFQESCAARLSIWTSAAHLICAGLTRRIRVQSVHLSPPTLPTTVLLVIKPPDQPAHREMNDCADEGACHNRNTHMKD